MSDWRLRLRPASFRGVAFHVEKHEGKAGRRTVVQEFADKDKAEVQDTGGVSPGFNIEAYVLGDDYMETRDALIAALNKPGPGRLVHPWLGSLLVTAAGEVPYRETTAEGGMAQFTINFIEGDSPRVLATEPATAPVVNVRADAAIAAAAEAFDEGFSVVGALQDARDLAAASIGDATAAVRQVKGAVSAIISSVENIAESIDQFEAGLNALLDLPSQLAGAFASLMRSITSFGLDLDGGASEETDNGAIAMTVFRSFTNFTPTGAPPSPETPQQQMKANNQRAIQELVQRVTTIEAARAVASGSFTTVDDAVNVNAELDDKLSALAADGAPDSLYLALSSLRVGLRNHIEQSAIDLPRIARFTPRATLPAIVIAQRLYGDPERSQEIVDRNSVEHPGFVIGGVELLVLSE